MKAKIATSSFVQNNTLSNLLLFAFIVLLPTQLALHFWPSWSFVYGIRVDYLAPTIYLSDLLVVVLFFLNIESFRNSLEIRNWKLVIAILFISLNIAFSVSPFITIFRWLKVIEFASVFYLFTKTNLTLEKLTKPLSISMIWVSILAILQFLFQETLGFWILGERSFNSGTPGIAKEFIGGFGFLRAYSTFPHPNALAGYLSVCLLLLLLSKNKSKLIFLAIGLSLITIVLSFSLNAIFFLILCFLIFYSKKIININYLILFSVVVSLIVPIFYSLTINHLAINTFPQTISRRLELSQSSLIEFTKSPLVGVGLGASINLLPIIQRQSLSSMNIDTVWFLQPVHNIYLLILSETGLLGLILFLYLIIKSFDNSLEIRNYKLVIAIFFILLTSMLDHYWLTSQQNFLLVAVVLGLSKVLNYKNVKS